MGIYVGAGGVKTVNSLYVGAGGVKTVTAVYVGAGGTYKVWPDDSVILDSSNFSDFAVYTVSSGSSRYNTGSIESYGLQISNSYAYTSYSDGYSRRVWQLENQFYKTYTSDALNFPNFDDYDTIHVMYNSGNPDTGNDTYSSHVYAGIFLHYYNSHGENDHYSYNRAGTASAQPGELVFNISSSMRSTYETAYDMVYNKESWSDTSLKGLYFYVGGYDSEKEKEWDYDDGYDAEMNIYYTRGYISKVWLE